MILALIYSLLAEISFLFALNGKRDLCHASKLALTVQSPSTTLDGTVQTAVSRAFLYGNSAVVMLTHITYHMRIRSLSNRRAC